MSTDDNVKKLPNANLAEPPLNWRKEAENLRATFVDRLAFMVELDRLKFARYKALVAQGFTESQALELVK